MSQCGIGSIVNKNNGKIYIFKSKNLTKCWEDYHALLNANYFHNQEFQDDWNEFGSNDFVFEIKEITDENDEILNQKFIEYLNNTNNTYNTWEINFEKIPFNYKTKVLLEELYNIIGETQINPIFLNKLSVYHIGQEYYPQIKADAEKHIKKGEIKIGEVDKFLDNLIFEINEKTQIELENKKENYLIELNSITGGDELSENYLDLLNQNGLSKEIGMEIKSEITELINNYKLNESVEEKVNNLIDEKKQLEEKKLQDNLILQLHDLTGQLDLTSEYIKKLNEKGLDSETGFIIRQNIKKDIQNGNIKSDSIETILDDALTEESERLAAENERKLIDYLYSLTGKDELSDQFKSKLDIFGLKQEKGYKIKTDILNLIKNREITEILEIDLKIDELIEQEIIEENKIKDNLLKQLHDFMGEDNLNDEFKSKLKSYNIDEEWGISLLKSLENDINSWRIDKDFDFEKHINNSILEKKEKDLMNYLNIIFNNPNFDDKLNEHFLNKDSSLEIKSELVKIIESKDIDALISLENNGLEKELDTRILEKYDKIKDEVLDIRENLLEDLYVVVNKEYVPKIKSRDYLQKTVDKIKNHIENKIKSDEIVDDKFKYKIDELNDLKIKTVKVTFQSLMDEEKRLEKIELDKIRKVLKNDLSDLCSSNKTSYVNVKLRGYELSELYLQRVEDKIIELIDSDKVKNTKFECKLDELTYLKENSLKEEINVVIDGFKKINDERLGQLYEVTGKDNLDESFKNKLLNKGLNEKAGFKLRSDFEVDIINERVVVDIPNKVYDRLNLMEIDKNDALRLLDDKIGSDGSKFFFATKLGKNNLDSDMHGMAIRRNMDELIQSGEVNPNNFDKILDKEVTKQVNLKNTRLKNYVKDTIGLPEIKESFINRLSKDYLNKEDAKQIRTQVLSAIDKNELEEGGAEDRINELIKEKSKNRLIDLLINKTYEIIGKDEINPEFDKRLQEHDLDHSDAEKLKNKKIQEIKKGKLTLDNLDKSIERDLKNMDRNHVKHELDILPGNVIDNIMKKHSLSTLMPFKGSKISKLLESVSLNDLKIDLAQNGVAKYKIKYGSGYSRNYHKNESGYSKNNSENSSNEENRFCTNCGSQLEKGARFCTECGTKID